MALILNPGPNEDQVVDENNSCYLEFDLLDPNDSTGETKVAGANVTSGNLELSNKSGALGDILTAIDVASKVDSNGHFKYLLTGANNNIIDDTDTPQFEDHIATITINFTATDAHTLEKNIRVRVMNQQFTT